MFIRHFYSKEVERLLVAKQEMVFVNSLPLPLILNKSDKSEDSTEATPSLNLITLFQLCSLNHHHSGNFGRSDIPDQVLGPKSSQRRRAFPQPRLSGAGAARFQSCEIISDQQGINFIDETYLY